MTQVFCSEGRRRLLITPGAIPLNFIYVRDLGSMPLESPFGEEQFLLEGLRLH